MSNACSYTNKQTCTMNEIVKFAHSWQARVLCFNRFAPMIDFRSINNYCCSVHRTSRSSSIQKTSSLFRSISLFCIGCTCCILLENQKGSLVSFRLFLGQITWYNTASTSQNLFIVSSNTDMLGQDIQGTRKSWKGKQRRQKSYPNPKKAGKHYQNLSAQNNWIRVS